LVTNYACKASYGQMDDQLEQVILDKIRKGNHSGCRYLIDKYKRMVYSISIQILKQEEEAEEVVQDTFVKAIRKINDFKGTGKFSTWLYKIAYYEALGRLRKKKIPVVSLDESFEQVHSEMDLSDGFELLAEADRQTCIKNAISQLSEEEQVLITLYYFEEMSHPEMEEITGINKNLIKIKIHRARKKLLSTITDYLREETKTLL